MYESADGSKNVRKHTLMNHIVFGHSKRRKSDIRHLLLCTYLNAIEASGEAVSLSRDLHADLFTTINEDMSSFLTTQPHTGIVLKEHLK